MCELIERFVGREREREKERREKEKKKKKKSKNDKKNLYRKFNKAKNEHGPETAEIRIREKTTKKG